jgi:hypothetical protein
MRGILASYFYEAIKNHGLGKQDVIKHGTDFSILFTKMVSVILFSKKKAAPDGCRP